MTLDAETLAVIPARGGSKRIPRKNLRSLGDDPLIAHTIEQADAASNVTRAIVSSEDEEIRSVAESHGGDVPFERPPELATDDATNVEVVEHALDWAESKGEGYDYVCLLQVTSPFRRPSDIDTALERLANSAAETVVTTSPFETPPFWAVESDEDGFLSPYFGEEYLWSKTQTQSVPTLRHPNGAVFAAATSAFRRESSFYTDRTAGVEMAPERSLDVDEPIDLRIARALYPLQNSE
jgi:CMP-N-acetylneuraminic acid synthetase